MKPTSTTWTLLLALFLMPAAALAQGVTTSALSGTIVDEAGGVLPGANIIAVHEPTGTQYGTTTNLNGEYTLVNMRPGGPYTVTASFIGFRAARETNLSLTLGQTRELDFVLQESTLELDEVEVVGTASNVLNSERTGASTNISEQTIDRLPTISRSLSDFARLTPQSTGGSSLAGRNNRYNNIQVDGATLNDVFGLSGTGAPGGQAGTQPISLDAIEAFNVDIAPYDVRYNGFTGGSVNAITRSGSNRFDGSVYYFRRNEGLVGSLENDAGDALDFPDFDEYFLGGRIGGPIIKNKLFFFANAELRRRNDPLTTGIAGTNAAVQFPVEASVLNRIISIANEQYGYDPGDFGELTQSEDNVKFLGKIDWNINPSNRLTLRHNYVDASDDDGIGRGREEFDLSNRLYVFNSVQNSTVAQLNTTFGASVFNEARLVYTRIRDQRDVQAEPFPEVSIQADPDDEDIVVNLGIDRFSQANRLDQDLIEFTNNLTWIRGDHSFLFGTSNQIFTFDNLFIQDYYGSYEFESVDAFEAGQPATYRFSYANPALDLPQQPTAEFTGYQLGFYAQDEWGVRPGLELTLGLRLDVPILPDEPVENPAAVDAFGRSTATIASGNLLWSPRLGFNWDASGGERTTQVRGGTGIFSGRTPYVWISNQYSNTGVDILRVDADDLPEDFFVPSANPADQPRPGTAEGLEPVETAEINLIEDDFTFPQVWRSNLAVDQQLPWGVIGTLEALYTKNVNDIVYENLNLEQTGTSAYGRPIYGAANGFFGSPARVDERFTNALLLKNASDGYSYSFTAQLAKQSRLGLDGSIAYTFNRAENVNNGTSSRAISNWQFNENFDVNNPRLSTADFEVRHRILANGSYRVEYQDRFATTVSLFYEGRSGAPFSWIYVGDANADGQNFNDLVYVPASEGEVVIEDGSWEVLDAFIRSEDALNDARGEVVERNAARASWINNLDLKITQEILTLEGQRVEVMANLFNVLNLLNSDWGEVQFVNFDNVAVWDFEGYADDGRPIIEFDDEDLQEIMDDRDSIYQRSDLASRWQLQLGVRYTF